MKNTIKKKLSINRQTLKSLKARQLQAVVGGGSPIDPSASPVDSSSWSNPGWSASAAVGPGYVY